MSWILNVLFGRRIRRETARYIAGLSVGPQKAVEAETARQLSELARLPGGTVSFGHTFPAGQAVQIPIKDVLGSHSTVTGGTGSGKTRFALNIAKRLMCEASGGFGIVDPKSDLFSGCLRLLSHRLEELSNRDVVAAAELRERIVIIDFGAADLIAPYNILSRWPDCDVDFFIAMRAELIAELMDSGDSLSLVGTGVLQKLLRLLCDSDLPITSLEQVLSSPAFLGQLVVQNRHETIRDYFTHQFPAVPQVTLNAIRRRLNSLFASETVRLALSGPTAPDFRQMQDESKIVLVNCAGRSISRGTRRLLQSLVISDIRQSIFSRSKTDCSFLWIVDEAQNAFATSNLREDMAEILCTARSFGSHLCLLTQNLGSAVQDARMQKILASNVKWSFSMRGEPADCGFLKEALPVSGRKLKPTTNPFEERSFHSISEERSMTLDSISSLPDRHGWLWLRSRSAEAIRITTEELSWPSTAEAGARALHSDPAIGRRVSRHVAEARITELRDLRLQPKKDEIEEMSSVLAKKYRQQQTSMENDDVD